MTDTEKTTDPSIARHSDAVARAIRHANRDLPPEVQERLAPGSTKLAKLEPKDKPPEPKATEPAKDQASDPAPATEASATESAPAGEDQATDRADTGEQARDKDGRFRRRVKKAVQAQEQLVERFTPFVVAKQAAEAGDVEGAVSALRRAGIDVRALLGADGKVTVQNTAPSAPKPAAKAEPPKGPSFDEAFGETRANAKLQAEVREMLGNHPALKIDGAVGRIVDAMRQSFDERTGRFTPPKDIADAIVDEHKKVAKTLGLVPDTSVLDDDDEPEERPAKPARERRGTRADTQPAEPTPDEPKDPIQRATMRALRSAQLKNIKRNARGAQ